jgi:hypothetical protein
MSDVEGLVGWSNSRLAGKLDTPNDDEAIRIYVSEALEADVADEAEDDETATLIRLVEEILVSHEVRFSYLELTQMLIPTKDEAVLKACLFLLWNLFLSAPRLWIDRASVMIRCCLVLRRSDSMSVSRPQARLEAFADPFADSIRDCRTVAAFRVNYFGQNTRTSYPAYDHRRSPCADTGRDAVAHRGFCVGQCRCARLYPSTGDHNGSDPRHQAAASPSAPIQGDTFT